MCCFDWLYDRLFVRPYVWFAHANRDDFVDFIFSGVAELSRTLNQLLSRTETGKVRWYAASIAIGAVITIAVVVML
jgi:NADH-quinone oxidoreductase subunit L